MYLSALKDRHGNARSARFGRLAFQDCSIAAASGIGLPGRASGSIRTRPDSPLLRQRIAAKRTARRKRRIDEQTVGAQALRSLIGRRTVRGSQEGLGFARAARQGL